MTKTVEAAAKMMTSPGAMESTSAPMARPSFQSVVKFLMGWSGTLFWTQASRRCLGVDSLGPPGSSSSHTGIEML